MRVRTQAGARSEGNMSFWIHKRDNQDRSHLWQIDVPIELVLLATGFLFLLIVVGAQRFSTPFAIAAGLITLTGLILLLLCKLSLFKQKIWISRGPSQMSKGYANLYKLAYVLLFAGLGLLILVTKLAV
jgi:hypothetical protein